MRDIKAYKRGLRDGVRAHAVNKDGEQLVGVQRRPLSAVLLEIENEDGYWKALCQLEREGIDE